MRSVLRVGHDFGTALRNTSTRVTTSVPRVRKLSSDELGAQYDTSWARKFPARTLRALLLATVGRGGVQLLGSPTRHNVEVLNDIKGPAIFAANHASHLDTSLLLTSLPKRFRRRSIVAAAGDYFFDRQWKAALWALSLNIIPIEREKVGRRSVNLAATLIDGGYNLIIFPEGTRSRDGSIAKFRGGAAYLSSRCNVPVIPVYLRGTHDIWQPGKSIKRGHTDVYFGTPISPEANERARDFNERIEQAVRQMADSHS